MSRARQHTNLAARMGRWSAAHWKTATFGWLALVVVAFAVGNQIGVKKIDPNTAGPGESGRMDRILNAGFKLPANESVLIQSSSARAGAPAFADDLKSAGLFSVPLTLIILVVAFGALVAAGIPLLLALTAVFATFGLVALPSHLLPIAQEAFAVVLLIGLAVGVDYSLFYLRREREERAAGRSERAALEAAAATSGRSVLISGLTVMVAMAGLFLTGDTTFASFGYATMIVVAFAMVGSLTVLPALLSKLGDRVDRLHVPLVGRLRRDNGEGRIWGAIVDRVLRRPLLSAVIAGGLLLALAVPALQMRMATPGPDTFPKSLDVVKTYNRMQEAFPGKALPANVVVKAPDVNAPTVRNAIAQLEQKALATGRARRPITIDTNSNHTIANITVPILGKGT